MSIIDALVLFVFGFVLPTWDVCSDIALANSFFIKKPCGWENYILDYMNRSHDDGKLAL